MTRDEILKELGIAPSAVKPVSGDLPGESPVATVATETSPTAFSMDRWSRERGTELVETGEYLPQVLGDRDDAANVAADCLHSVFDPDPQLAESCADPDRQRYFQRLVESADYRELHAETQYDDLASEMAATHIAQGFVELAEEAEKERERGEGTEGNGTSSEDGDLDLPGRRVAREAIKEALDEVDDLRNAQRSLGGFGADPGKGADLASIRERMSRIKNNAMLRRILELAGRYRMSAQAAQRQKVLHGRDDVVGVELAGDLSRATPPELALMAHPATRMDAYRRWLDNALQCTEYRGVESKGQGPIVVVVDESGSMRYHDRIEQAKAFALAMGWIAKHQKRWICFVGFSGGTEGNFLCMPPDKWDDSELLDWLEHFYGGGTDMDVALATLPDRWDELGVPKGKTDVIQITDAICDVPDDLRDRFLAWKATSEAKYYTIVIGTDYGYDDCPLRAVSDRLWFANDLSLGQDAVQEMFAL